MSSWNGMDEDFFHDVMTERNSNVSNECNTQVDRVLHTYQSLSLTNTHKSLPGGDYLYCIDFVSQCLLNSSWLSILSALFFFDLYLNSHGVCVFTSIFVCLYSNSSNVVSKSISGFCKAAHYCTNLLNLLQGKLLSWVCIVGDQISCFRLSSFALWKANTDIKHFSCNVTCLLTLTLGATLKSTYFKDRTDFIIRKFLSNWIVVSVCIAWLSNTARSCRQCSRLHPRRKLSLWAESNLGAIGDLGGRHFWTRCIYCGQ